MTRHYRLGAHTQTDLKVHLIWAPKYRKPVLAGEVAVRVRDLLRQIAAEHDLVLISGKVVRDHVHVLVSYRPTQQVSEIMQWFKGISSRILLQEYPKLRRVFWERHFWARGYFAVSSGTVTDEMIRAYIDEQQGEQIADDSRFPIDHRIDQRADHPQGMIGWNPILELDVAEQGGGLGIVSTHLRLPKRMRPIYGQGA